MAAERRSLTCAPQDPIDVAMPRGCSQGEARGGQVGQPWLRGPCLSPRPFCRPRKALESPALPQLLMSHFAPPPPV